MNIRLMLLLIPFISCQFLQAQNDKIKIYNSKTLTKGLYKSYSEYLNNSPSIVEDFILKPIKKHKSDTTFERANFELINTKNEYEDIWGFCDGNNIYVNFPYSSSTNIYCKLEYNGIVPYFAFNPFKQNYRYTPVLKENSGSAAKIRANADMKAVLSDPNYYLVVLLKDGEFKFVTIELMKQILKAQPTLVEFCVEKMEQYIRFRDLQSYEYRDYITAESELDMIRRFLKILDESHKQ